MADNWCEIKKIILNNWNGKNDVSMIIPRIKEETPRLINMGNYRLVNLDYHNFKKTDLDIILHKSQFKKYYVESDISNCFGSCYSHSICWALAGKEAGKEHRRGKWFNKIDEAVQSSHNGETNGISIGPDTSGIIIEIILSSVDKKLLDKGFEFIRYIDDYRCFCETKEKAEEFIRELGNALQEYKMIISSKKIPI